ACFIVLLARPAGREPATTGLEGRCSIRLSYGRLRTSYRRRRMVGAEGFEPPNLWSQTRCATRLRYAPIRALRCAPAPRKAGHSGPAAAHCQRRAATAMLPDIPKTALGGMHDPQWQSGIEAVDLPRLQ